MKVGIITFPGSNCNWDIFHILQDFFQPQVTQVEMLWHERHFDPAERYDLLVLPGGFSYGDYLRVGAIARFAPIMQDLRAHAAAGRAVLGICNGFQILCEAGFLPGALLRNKHLRHICKDVTLRGNTANRFAHNLQANVSYSIPISHSEGNYYVDADTLSVMQDKEQIVFHYQEKPNPNGSVADIAAVSDEDMRILGMMPHPERAVDPLIGGSDGKAILQSILNAL